MKNNKITATPPLLIEFSLVIMEVSGNEFLSVLMDGVNFLF